MGKYKTVREREDDLRQKPVEYWPNGEVKTPVTWTQLAKECARQRAEIKRLRAIAEASERLVDLLGY